MARQKQKGKKQSSAKPNPNRGRSAGCRPAGYRDVDSIKTALEPFVKGRKFIKYPTDRDQCAIKVQTLTSKRYMAMIRRMHVLNPTWNFLPAAIIEALIEISKAGAQGFQICFDSVRNEGTSERDAYISDLGTPKGLCGLGALGLQSFMAIG